MVLKKSVRIVKKINEGGVWKFVSLKQVQGRYEWDQRPGQYFLDWWEGDKRRREFAGATPSQALTAQKRKRMEVAGALALNGAATHTAPAQSSASPYQTRLITLFDTASFPKRRLDAPGVWAKAIEAPPALR